MSSRLRLSMPSAIGEAVPIAMTRRLEWTDALVVDRRLSHLAVRVACVAGALMARAGDHAMAQAALADRAGIAPRDVGHAVEELTQRGWLRTEPWRAP